MIRIIKILLLTITVFSCNSQSNPSQAIIVGGPCEDCEAALDYKQVNFEPTSSLTFPDFEQTEPKIKISGTVYLPDVKTPATDIILYIYHTNRDGIYQASDNPISWEKRHGKYRSWIKTDTDGKYEFLTFKPAAYPNGQEPAHIHLYIKEPDKIAYYADNYVFDDDPLLTKEERNSFDNRSGSGIIVLEKRNGILEGKRDIILGLNIPGYPD